MGNKNNLKCCIAHTSWDLFDEKLEANRGVDEYDIGNCKMILKYKEISDDFFLMKSIRMCEHKIKRRIPFNLMNNTLKLYEVLCFIYSLGMLVSQWVSDFK